MDRTTSTAIEFLNAADVLGDERALQAALAGWSLGPGRRLRPSEVTALRDLHELLGRLTDTVSAGRTLSPRDLTEFNGVIASAPVRAALVAEPDGGYSVEMTPVAERWIDLAVRELAGSFSSMLRRATPPRLKRCENDGCRRAFHDETKNRTRRWCDSRTCGNRIRVRRHRARRA